MPCMCNLCRGSVSRHVSCVCIKLHMFRGSVMGCSISPCYGCMFVVFRQCRSITNAMQVLLVLSTSNCHTTCKKIMHGNPVSHIGLLSLDQPFPRAGSALGPVGKLTWKNNSKTNDVMFCTSWWMSTVCFTFGVRRHVKSSTSLT